MCIAITTFTIAVCETVEILFISEIARDENKIYVYRDILIL